MKNFVIKNLTDNPRDYPLNNGESLFLGCRGVIEISEDLISKALRLAEHKGLISIDEIRTEAE